MRLQDIKGVEVRTLEELVMRTLRWNTNCSDHFLAQPYFNVPSWNTIAMASFTEGLANQEEALCPGGKSIFNNFPGHADGKHRGLDRKPASEKSWETRL